MRIPFKPSFFLVLFLSAFFAGTDLFAALIDDDVLVDETSIYKRSLSEELAYAKQDLEDYYNQLLVGDFFGDQYNNNLILEDLCLEKNVQQSAAMILRLVLFLERKNDQDSCVLLKKIDKFSFLKMHRLLASGDLQKRSAQRILSCLEDLYGHKIVTPEGVLSPFRTVLTKLLIVLFLINDGQAAYASRKETMLLHMNKIKQELLGINNTLGGQKIDQQIIKDFTTLVAINQTRKPIIQPNNFKNVMIGFVVCSIVLALIYWKRDDIKNAMNPMVEWFREAGVTILQGWKGSIQLLGESLGKSLFDALVAPLPVGTPINPPAGAVNRGMQVGASIVAGANANAGHLVGQIQNGLRDVIRQQVAPGGDIDNAINGLVAPGGAAHQAGAQIRRGVFGLGGGGPAPVEPGGVAAPHMPDPVQEPRGWFGRWW